MSYDRTNSNSPTERNQPPHPPPDSHPDTRASHPSAASENHQEQSNGINGMHSDSSSRPRTTGPTPVRTDGVKPAPIFDSVNSAFDNSTAAKQVDPDIIAQITEQVRNQVLDSLKGIVPQPTPGLPKSSAPEQSFFQRSPTNSTTPSIPPRDVYTPPSPHRHDSADSSAPQSPLRDPRVSAFRDELKSRSKEPLADGFVDASRRPPPQRQTTSDEETTLERIWQPLFDADGNPTTRLGQFLRGLAIHIIEDYEPRKSVVITPAKMMQFYEDVRLMEETYQWSRIFGKQEYRTIGKMYQDLNCQHHLVQSSLCEAPHIPALTPEGFQTWMTVLIQAHPEAEFERMAKAVLDMPISNADDSKERFPKELSRRLFPRKENIRVRERCATALGPEATSPTSSRASSFTVPPPPSYPPPPNQRTYSTGAFTTENGFNKPSFSSNYQRAYASSVGSNSSGEAEAEDDGPPPVAIERERKPYSAQPGKGKLYDTDDTSSSTHSLRNDLNRADPRHFRTNSTASDIPYSSSTPSSRPPMGSTNIPPEYTSTSSTPRGGLNGGLHRHPSMSARDNPRRGRSPTFGGMSSNPYTQSAPQNLAEIPPSYYRTNLPSNLSTQMPMDHDDHDVRRYSKPERRQTFDERDSDRYLPRYHDDEYRKGTSGYGSYGGYPPPPPRY